MSRGERRHLARRAEERTRFLLVHSLDWFRDLTSRELRIYAERSPRNCRNCPWCAGSRTVATRRRAARAEWQEPDA